MYDNTMIHLSEALISKRTGNYLKPNKFTILDWLAKNGFLAMDKRTYKNPHEFLSSKLSKEDRKIFFIGPVLDGDKEEDWTNWLSIHTKNIFELVIWFNTDSENSFKEAEVRSSNHTIKRLDFDEVKRMLNEEV